VTPPIASPTLVARGEDCAFYGDVSGLAAAPGDGAKVFDGLGRRMAVASQGSLDLVITASVDHLGFS
jgi:hypothetical protein